MSGRSPMKATAHAAIDGLCRVPEDAKAELVDGELILTRPTGIPVGDLLA